MLNRKNSRCKSYIVSGSEKHNGYAGGFFYELAKTVLRRNGLVIGAAYTKDFSVEHIKVDDMATLNRIMGVKYAESKVDEKLKYNIKCELQKNRVVLFAGVPCQIRDMYRYLDEEYENFYTVAVKCSGVICSKVWKDYIEETQSYGSVITEIYCPYRGEFGISQTKILIKFSHGTAYFRDEKQDKLLILKKAGLIFKNECYQCSCNEDLDADLFLEIYYKNGRRDAIQEEGLTQVSVFTDRGMNLFLDTHSLTYFGEEATEDKEVLFTKPIQPENYDYFRKYYDRYGFTFASNLILLQMDIMFQNKFLQKFLIQYAVLDAKGITLEKILDNWGLNKVIIYGHDVRSNIFMDKLKNANRVYGVIDEELNDHIINIDLPILFTASCFISDIMEIFKEKKIEPRRLLPVNLLINAEYESKVLKGPDHTVWDKKNKGLGNIFLVTGAQFENKGAQSMLFVTVNELRKKYPDCDIYYLPVDSIKNYPDTVIRKYRFHVIREGREIFGQLYDLIPQLKAIIDVSGYALASKWNCSHFIEILLFAKNNDIPIYYMPQSFGPLDFAEDWDQKIKEGLMHAKIIFAREKSGYDLLIKKYGLKNVRLSEDLVLQNKKIDFENIYLESPQFNLYKLKTDCNVAIVPNIRTYEFGDKGDMMKIYRLIIHELLKKGKNVYIVAHSNDEQVCNDIYEMFSMCENVFMYRERLDCLEYSILVKEFEYIIASRYHAIVHAYKEGVPCIAIGWAEKYRELLTLFGQEKYMFDVRLGINEKELIKAMDCMEETWMQEKEKLREILPALQTENCFDVI